MRAPSAIDVHRRQGLIREIDSSIPLLVSMNSTFSANPVDIPCP